jgi:hypothetical protein
LAQPLQQINMGMRRLHAGMDTKIIHKAFPADRAWQMSSFRRATLTTDFPLLSARPLQTSHLTAGNSRSKTAAMSHGGGVALQRYQALRRDAFADARSWLDSATLFVVRDKHAPAFPSV